MKNQLQTETKNGPSRRLEPVGEDTNVGGKKDNKNAKYWYIAVSLTTSFGYFAIIMGAGHKFNIHNLEHKTSAFYLILTLINSFVIFSNHIFGKIMSFFTLIGCSVFYGWVIDNLFSTKIEEEDLNFVITFVSLITSLILFSIYLIWRLIFSHRWY